MRVDKPRRHGAAGGIEDVELRGGRAAGLERCRQRLRGRGPGGDRDDSPVQAGDRGSGRGDRGVGLGRSSPQPAGQRGHLGGVDDEQPALGHQPPAARASRSSKRHERRRVAELQEAARGEDPLLRRRVLGRTRAVGHRLECRQRCQPYQLGLSELHAIRRGLRLDHLPGRPERRPPEVEEVHRHLGAAELLDEEALGLEGRQPARRFADPVGDPLGQLEVVGGEVDVPGDEERPRSHACRPAARMHPGRSEVRLPAASRDLRRGGPRTGRGARRPA